METVPGDIRSQISGYLSNADLGAARIAGIRIHMEDYQRRAAIIYIRRAMCFIHHQIRLAEVHEELKDIWKFDMTKKTRCILHYLSTHDYEWTIYKRVRKGLSITDHYSHDMSLQHVTKRTRFLP